MVLVEALGQLKGALGAESETAVGLALEGGQVVEERGSLGGRLLGLLDDPRLTGALRADLVGPCMLPETFGFLFICLVTFGLLEALVEPASRVAASCDCKLGMDLKVGLRHEGTDLLLTLDQDRKRRCLDATHRGQLESALTRVHGSKGAGAVDPDEPVALGAADRCRGQRLHVGIVAQVGESLLDRLLGHRLKPESLDRLFAAGELDDVVENQLTLTAGVAGVDDGCNLRILEEIFDYLEPVGRTLDRLKFELLGNDRQGIQLPGEAFPSRHLVRQAELDQVTHGGGDDVVIDLEELGPCGLPSQSPCQIGGNTRFLGDD